MTEKNEKLTIGEIIKGCNEDEGVYFHHKLHGKIMPEEIMIPVTKVSHNSYGVILS